MGPERCGRNRSWQAVTLCQWDASWPAARLLARDLRHAGLRVLIDYEGRSSKSQMKRANRSGARQVLLLGEDELANNQVTVKEMETGQQQTVARDQVTATLLQLARTD